MKTLDKLTPFLRCPICHASGIEKIATALLACASCGAAYPVVNGIARMLKSSKLPEWVSGYDVFVREMDPATKARLPEPILNTESGKTVFMGLQGRGYAETREKVATVKYSLRRRMEAIRDALENWGVDPSSRLLELGCADGRIGSFLTSHFHLQETVGVDLQDTELPLAPFLSVQGDCQDLPFADQSFDILVGAALIEHLPKPHIFLTETYRVLSAKGVLVLTCPVPVWDWICTMTGYFKYSNHLHRFSIRRLRGMMLAAGFQCIIGKKFMLLPMDIGVVGWLEKSRANMMLSPVMMNQVVIAKRS